MPPNSAARQTAAKASPLSNFEAENNLLSIIVSNAAESLDRVVEAGVKPDCLGHPHNRLVFETACDLQRRGIIPSATILRSELIKTKRWDSESGDEAFERLLDRPVSVADLEYYIEMVLEMATLRRIHRVGTQVAHDAAAIPEDFRAFVDQAESAFLAAAEDRAGNPMIHAGHAVSETVNLVRHAIATRGAPTGLRTGYKHLDDLTFGLQPGDLVVIAGRPSMGKSTFAINIAENVANGRPGADHGPVAVFSLEMSRVQLGFKLLASKVRQSINRLRQGFTDDKTLEKAQAEIDQYELHIDDSSSLSVMEIKARARRLHQRKKLKAIVVDYLQLVRPTDSRAPREQQVAEISRAMKGMAKELGVPVLLLAQLNRAPDTDGRKPKLSDLRESGAIEQDADVVVLLSQHPSCTHGAGSVATDYIVCDVAKNRMGSVEDFTLRFHREFSRFDNLTPADTETLRNFAPAPAGGKGRKGA